MIIAGGGTGGHLFPGLAVAEMLTAQGGANVLFVGSAYGIEATVVPQTPYPFHALAIRGLRGRGLRGALGFVIQLPIALLRAWRIVAAFRPTLVLGLGGYSSVPVVLTAWVRRVPSVLLEQNAHPGWATRFLAPLARRVCTTFPESARFFTPGKALHTGNPVRQLGAAQQPSPQHFTLFAFGGSQGAHTINRAVVDAARILTAQLPNVRVVHQTGAADAESVERAYAEMRVPAEVRAFVHDMGEAYGSADLVICRAGATTLAELATLGKPAILIPYPHAADDHQRANADVLVQHGAAERIDDADLSGETLAGRVLALWRDPARLQAMAAAARQLAVPDAAARVLAVCRRVAEERE